MARAVARGAGAWLLAALCCLTLSSAGGAVTFAVHNPANVTVTEIHMVLSSHFDAGCKTPGCGLNRPGEPNRCATTRERLGEPFCYHILNRYFDEYLGRAVTNAQQMRGTDTPYSYMTQPWVLSLFFDCERSGMRAWEHGPYQNLSTPVLHCPSPENVTAVKEAMKRGDIFMHSFAHDGEASYYPDASLFEAAIEVSERIADDVGIPRPTVVSQRDVPGWTRAALPILNKHNISGLTFGAGVPPGKPDTPMVFVWRDEASDSEVVTTYETAYGDIKTVFVLPNGVAMTAAWSGDNSGPGSTQLVADFYHALRQEFPTANVHASTFDAFFEVANQPEVKAQLPVVTKEIGDGWIYGVPSDPLKNALFREASRQRLACLNAGACDKATPEMQAFDRLLVKVPEHTWGVAFGWFFFDEKNWSNTEFDRALSYQHKGFLPTNADHADYNTTVNSWLEQRSFITHAPEALAARYPSLATSLHKAFAEIQGVAPPSTSGLSLLPDPSVLNRCGGTTLAFDQRGAITALSHGGTDFASAAHPLGLLLYQTFTNVDYNVFLQDFAADLDNKGCKYVPWSPDDLGCQNFRKPNVSSAEPEHRELVPSLVAAWKDPHATCKFVLELTFDAKAQRLAGAPSNVYTTVEVDGGQLDFSLIWTKRPTRLPESLSFVFNPPVDPKGWTLKVLNSTMDPTDVLGHRNGTSVVYGGSPHLRGVEAANWSNGSAGLSLSSLDVPVLCTGSTSPFVSPRTQAPDMSKGVSFNILNNIWNTNYVLWYPFMEADKYTRSRFSLSLR